LGGRDDVGEEYGGQNAVDLSRRSLPGEELGDLADHRPVVTTKEESIVAGYLDQASAINMSDEVACSLGIGGARGFGSATRAARDAGWLPTGRVDTQLRISDECLPGPHSGGDRCA
jgi:hypothetical protein